MARRASIIGCDQPISYILTDQAELALKLRAKIAA